jgi:hypothetical protein
MLKLLRSSLQLELNRFFNSFKNGVSSFSSSAFVQSRKKLKPDLFFDLNQLIVKEYYKNNKEEIELYKGHRLLSIDGSTINLPVTEELKEIYKTLNNQHPTDDLVIGRVSVLYDVLNELVLDGKLRPYEQGEITLSRTHFQHLTKGDLLIADRAYPSFESAWLLNQQGVQFLFRCKISFSHITQAFFDSGKEQQEVIIRPKSKRSFKGVQFSANSALTVRLIRVELSSGEVEILMTSLTDIQKYPHRDFKELYFKRWSIETFYDRFKNIIGVECFSGTSEQFIQQEFNCALYMASMQTILTEEAENLVDQKYEHRKYQYKVNRSLSLGFIRDRLIDLYTADKKMEVILKELHELFLMNVIPIRPGRNNKRDVDKYRKRTKPKQFPNRRNGG